MDKISRKMDDLLDWTILAKQENLKLSVIDCRLVDNALKDHQLKKLFDKYLLIHLKLENQLHRYISDIQYAFNYNDVFIEEFSKNISPYHFLKKYLLNLSQIKLKQFMQLCFLTKEESQELLMNEGDTAIYIEKKYYHKNLLIAVEYEVSLREAYIFLEGNNDIQI